MQGGNAVHYIMCLYWWPALQGWLKPDTVRYYYQIRLKKPVNDNLTRFATRQAKHTLEMIGPTFKHYWMYNAV